MKIDETLAALKKLGKPRTAATYERHGLGDDAFGVSFADLGKLAKKIGHDHALALALWASGIVDARLLATMVADPARLDAKTVDRWLGTAKGHFLVDLTAAAVAKTAFAVEAVDRSRAASGEVERSFGYALVAHLLKNGAPLADAQLRRILGDIERDIHGSPNRARYAMNGALIAIGTWRLPDEAVAAAQRIGTVEVDHGDTACQTPAAVPYIQKARARVVAQQKAPKKAATKKAPAAKKTRH